MISHSINIKPNEQLGDFADLLFERLIKNSSFIPTCINMIIAFLTKKYVLSIDLQTIYYKLKCKNSRDVWLKKHKS